MVNTGGSVTLALRRNQHNESALAIAQYLESLDCISFVSYPGLESNRVMKLLKNRCLMVMGYDFFWFKCKS